jgi:prepilin-type N-terminal cleavage/methylation domain-containing protein
MSRTNRPTPSGFTLVEVIAATAIMAALTTSSFALVRTSYAVWTRHRDDAQRRQEAIAALQHIIRRVRQASEVTAISAAADNSGALTLLMPDGTSAMWDHNAATSQVLYGAVAPTNLVATGITETTFIGIKADGATQTATPALIHAVNCTVKYTLNRPSGAITETVSCMAWLRAW